MHGSIANVLDAAYRKEGAGAAVLDHEAASIKVQSPPYAYLDAIIDYENDELDDEETVVLFQYLVTTGLAWSLQGHYGRTAARLIDEGLVAP